jgi:hypothetical protein
MRNTPSAALEYLYDIPPIDIYMEGLALKAMARLMQSGQWLDWAGRGRRLARRRHIDQRTRLSSMDSEIQLPCDHETDFLPARLYEVVIKSRKEWEEQGSPVSIGPVVNCFTDG